MAVAKKKNFFAEYWLQIVIGLIIIIIIYAIIQTKKKPVKTSEASTGDTGSGSGSGAGFFDWIFGGGGSSGSGSATSDDNNKELKLGSSGEAVGNLQGLLNRISGIHNVKNNGTLQDISVDESFGNITLTRVKLLYPEYNYKGYITYNELQRKYKNLGWL